jgi:hypothetical protein
VEKNDFNFLRHKNTVCQAFFLFMTTSAYCQGLTRQYQSQHDAAVAHFMILFFTAVFHFITPVDSPLCFLDEDSKIKENCCGKLHCQF